MQTNIGILAACFNARAELSERSFSVIQRLEYMNYHGEQVCNDYDCPLLSLITVCLLIVLVTQFLQYMSVLLPVHLEPLNLQLLLNGNMFVLKNLSLYMAYISNSLYALNVYCMHLYY